MVFSVDGYYCLLFGFQWHLLVRSFVCLFVCLFAHVSFHFLLLLHSFIRFLTRFWVNKKILFFRAKIQWALPNWIIMPIIRTKEPNQYPIDRINQTRIQQWNYQCSYKKYICIFISVVFNWTANESAIAQLKWSQAACWTKNLTQTDSHTHTHK